MICRLVIWYHRERVSIRKSPQSIIGALRGVTLSRITTVQPWSEMWYQAVSSRSPFKPPLNMLITLPPVLPLERKNMNWTGPRQKKDTKRWQTARFWLTPKSYPSTWEKTSWQFGRLELTRKRFQPLQGPTPCKTHSRAHPSQIIFLRVFAILVPASGAKKKQNFEKKTLLNK